MPKIIRIKNKTHRMKHFDFGDGTNLRLPGRDKNKPDVNISRPVTSEQIKCLDVQVNLKANDIELIVEEV